MSASHYRRWMGDGCATKLIGWVITVSGVWTVIYGLTRPEQSFHVRATVCLGIAIFLTGTGLLNHIGWRARTRSH
ncbi:hypothetical protein HNO88_004211 [Novosphingobium chloroacetimidivorans]|uniref:Uncharacterized protein n=1 Tax=Novosphingobium chloroacetimidivorans TaxID=1428314 RepID=A0A7W7KE67_9SPHN|nr:hypothetical protein [Novosphingobium chloroacetimidivorans]